MAYLRKQTIDSGTYYYICKSTRVRGKVTTKVLEYLGKSPSRERLAAAKAYWGVKAKRKGGTR
jgi:hypothetical protein